MDAIRLLEKDQLWLEAELAKGKNLIDVICPQSNNVFDTHLRFFYKIMSLPHAIESALALSTFEKNIRHRLLKKSAYPILIFVMAYGMLWFFTSAIIPQMISSFEGDSSFQNLSFMIKTIQAICFIIGVCILVILCIAIYLHFHKDVRVIVLSKRKFTLLQDYESFLFSGYLIQMEKHGLSTKDSMHFFSNIEKGSVFQKMVEQMHKKLLDGMDYLEVIATSPFLSKTFQQSFRIGCAANKLQTTLECFMQQQESIWNSKIKRYTILIQCTSYTFVGFVILIVYQIMLVPLQMLEQM